jgi:universal stress protein A
MRARSETQEMLMPAYRHILVPTDFSAEAARALHTATELARQYDAELHLLHVVAPQLYYAEMPDIMLPPIEDLTAVMIQAAEKRLREIADKLGDELRVQQHVYEGQRMADAIVAAAAELGAGLIVIGSHGNTGLMHVLLGSTAERVIREAACDVLVIKRKNNA